MLYDQLPSSAMSILLEASDIVLIKEPGWLKCSSRDLGADIWTLRPAFKERLWVPGSSHRPHVTSHASLAQSSCNFNGRYFARAGSFMVIRFREHALGEGQPSSSGRCRCCAGPGSCLRANNHCCTLDFEAPKVRPSAYAMTQSVRLLCAPKSCICRGVHSNCKTFEPSKASLQHRQAQTTKAFRLGTPVLSM